MGTEKPERDKIFNEAAEITDAAARAAFLDKACGDDPTLRADIEDLLRRDEEVGDFLESPPSGVEATVDATPNTPVPGAMIGPYKLRERLGEGGMGVVWAAEQKEPLRRKVALKVVKPGMDTEQVLARFEAEREALALMDHPNIARVLDAGTTAQGRPYFVMELIRGVPITEYCDAHRLTVRQRLELFVPVCRAVQHAHQKAIIHRDLKPSNVLVTLHDDRPVPKVIDFGVAKALHQPLTDRSIYTGVFQAIGTLAYMSPEQTQLSGLNIDTRADVYGLGVLLYELLTGVTPFDNKTLASAALDEAFRIIREKEPAKPSTRVSTLGERADSVSRGRKTNITGLGRTIRGDLDWIVMKALDKDRTRRYDTANGLASDVTRYLNGEPIEARPPSLVYVFHRFARRHRVAVATSTLILLSLLLGVVATTWMATVAWNRLRMVASAYYDKAVADILINDQEQAEKSLKIAQQAGASPAQVLVLRGLMALNRGENDEAIRLADSALEHVPNDTSATALRAVACVWSGYDDLGELEIGRLRRLELRSDADRLLMAYALMSCEPRHAKRLLDATPGIQRSPVGLLIRGFSDATPALPAGVPDKERCDRAVRDFEYVQYLFHDNRASLGFRLLALADAIQRAHAEGRDEDVRRYTEEGRTPAERLSLVSNYAAGDWSLHLYYRAVGDSERAWQAIRNVGRHPGTYSWFLAAHCLERYGVEAHTEFDKATAEHRSSKYVRLAKAYLSGHSPIEAPHVYRLVEDLVDDPSPFLRRHALLALWPVCEPSQIRTLAKPTTNTGLWFDAACLKYLSGELDELQLIDQAGQNYSHRSNVYFTLAMMCLAARDRDGAYAHFRKCVDTNAVGWFDYEWATGFLAHMDRDPHWPDSDR